MRIRLLLSALLILPALVNAAEPSAAKPEPPKYNAEGQLLYPADVDRWVVLGASIGMGYNEQDFDAKNPGSFVTVSMPQDAYDYFKQHKRFADGTVFARRSYPAVQRLANNRAGFVMGEPTSTEIHVIDSQRFKDGFNFAVFMTGQKQAAILPEGNGCIACHKANAAFQNTFAQFYPAIRHDIPAEQLAASLKAGNVTLE